MAMTPEGRFVAQKIVAMGLGTPVIPRENAGSSLKDLLPNLHVYLL